MDDTLKKGNRGDAVKVLQTVLIANGADLGPTGADGIFGDYTERAVMAFQAAHGLAADGVVGPATAAVLSLDTAGGSTAGKVIGGNTADASPARRAAWYAASAGLLYFGYRRWFKK